MKRILNKIQIVLMSSVMALSFNSCGDWLEILPEGETLLEDYWQNASDVQGVVASCYRSMLEPACIARMILWGEVRSDNINPGSKVTTDQKYLLEANILPTNVYCDWSTLYTVINYCNTVLHFAPQVQDVDKNYSPRQMNAHRAEAQAIRALCYFYLVRAFRDVPFNTEPTIDDDKEFDLPATPGSIILDYMIADLKEAKQNAQSSYTGSNALAHNKGRFNRQSIRALLADIYLWKGMYKECLDECNEFLDYNASLSRTSRNSGYSLVDPDFFFDEVFSRGNSSESIFELQFESGTELSNSSISSFYGNSKDAGQLSASASAIRSWAFPMEDDDIRSNLFIGSVRDELYNEITKYSCSSCIDNGLGGYTFSYRTKSDCNWIVYRLSDIYLIRAEALVELAKGKETQDVQVWEKLLRESISMVNKTWFRSHPTNRLSDTLSFDEYGSYYSVRDLVFMERQREFLFEGKRWFDLVRKAEHDNDPTSVWETVDHKYDSRFYNTTENLMKSKYSSMDALYLPVSEDEILANDSIQQNPFYRTNETSSKNN